LAKALVALTTAKNAASQATSKGTETYWAGVKKGFVAKYPDVKISDCATRSASWTSAGGWMDCLTCSLGSTLVLTNPGIGTGWCNGYSGACHNHCHDGKCACKTCISNSPKEVHERGKRKHKCTTCKQGYVLHPSFEGGSLHVGICRAIPTEVSMRTSKYHPIVPNPKGGGLYDSCYAWCKDDRPLRGANIPRHESNVILCSKACREQELFLSETLIAECTLEKEMKFARCVDGVVIQTGAVCPDGVMFVGTTRKSAVCSTAYKQADWGRKGDILTFSSGATKLTGCEAAGSDPTIRADLGCTSTESSIACSAKLCSRRAAMF